MTDSCAADDALDRPISAEEPAELVVITGMSGAGRSEAIHTFEDLGYFCIDNLPPSFIPQLVDLAELPGSSVRRLAVVCDVRAHEFFDELAGELKRLEDRGIDEHVLFLEADDETLLRRFKETRRRHPMCDEGESIVSTASVPSAIALDEIRARADVVIDTSDLRPRELRAEIRDRFFAESIGTTLVDHGVRRSASSTGARRCRHRDGRALPAQPVLRSRAAPAHGTRRAGARVRARPSRDRGVPRALAAAARRRGARLRHGGQAPPRHRAGLHRRHASQRRPRRDDRDASCATRGYRVAVSHRDIGRDRERR